MEKGFKKNLGEFILRPDLVGAHPPPIFDKKPGSNGIGICASIADHLCSAPEKGQGGERSSGEEGDEEEERKEEDCR